MSSRIPDLTTKLGPLELKNPVITASGTFGYGLEYASLMDLNRLGALVVKGLSLKPMAGNPPPRIVETACGMLNAIGLENVGVEAFLFGANDLLPVPSAGKCLWIPLLGHNLPVANRAIHAKSLSPCATR